MKTLRPFPMLAGLLLASCTAFPLYAQTQPVADGATHWQIDTVPLRTAPTGGAVTLGLAVRLPPPSVPLKHIVLAFSTSSSPTIEGVSETPLLKASTPWLRASANFNARGIGIAFADVPSDVNGRSVARRGWQIGDDLRVSLAALAKKYPGIDISVGTFSANTVPLLDALKKNGDVAKIIIVSGDFLDARTSDWHGLKTAVMTIHAPSSQCDSSPFYEAELVSKANNFTLVKAGYREPEKKASCDTGSQSRLSGLDEEFAGVTANWLDNQPAPATIGYATPQTAWREQVLLYMAGSKKLEMTLLLPDGPGPFPVMVYNHGDIEVGTAWFKYKRRYREMIVAREFLRYGVAVAMPARPGVGMSEGVYLIPNSRGDADASYKGRLHAENIMPAFELLKTIPELDAKRIIVTGQSAGGYSTMYIASQNPPGVIGAVNYSGGRTDIGGQSGPGYLNSTMVNAFEEAGKTTRVPVLMIFAEGDSRYSPNTIRHAYQAFIDAGGKGTLSLSPPINTDGHFVYHQPAYWRETLRTYLQQIGIVPAQAEKPATETSDGTASVATGG